MSRKQEPVKCVTNTPGTGAGYRGGKGTVDGLETRPSRASDNGLRVESFILSAKRNQQIFIKLEMVWQDFADSSKIPKQRVKGCSPMRGGWVGSWICRVKTPLILKVYVYMGRLDASGGLMEITQKLKPSLPNNHPFSSFDIFRIQSLLLVGFWEGSSGNVEV